MWPKLNEPDVYQPKKGEAKIRYLTDAKLEDADLAKLKGYLGKLAKEHLPDVKKPKLPIKTDKKTEDELITASSGAKYRPPVFDAKNERVPPSVIIGGGTKAKLDLTVNFYEISKENSGINFYINGVQVLDLQEGGFKSNFEEAEGFSYKGFGGDDDKETSDHNEDDDEDSFAF